MTENKVRVKYKTKNIIRNDKEFFFKITNQTRARMRSRRNFSPIATRLCIVCASGCRACPRMKIVTVMSEIRVNPARSMMASPIEIFSPPARMNR